jgi:hypothetical protein
MVKAASIPLRHGASCLGGDLYQSLTDHFATPPAQQMICSAAVNELLHIAARAQ